MQAGDAKASNVCGGRLSAGYGGKTKQGGWADPATAEMMGVQLDSMDNKMILAQKGMLLECLHKLHDEDERKDALDFLNQYSNLNHRKKP